MEKNKKAFGLYADPSAPALMPQENMTVMIGENDFGMPKVYMDGYEAVTNQINEGIKKTRAGLKK